MAPSRRAPHDGAALRLDRPAGGSAVDADGDRCFAIAYRILRDVEAAQDAVQQAFLLAWARAAQAAAGRALRRLAPPTALERLPGGIATPATVDEPDPRVAGRRAAAPDPTVSVHDPDLLERAFARLSPASEMIDGQDGRYRISWLLPGQTIDITLPEGWRLEDRMEDRTHVSQLRDSGGPLDDLGLPVPTEIYSDPCGLGTEQVARLVQGQDSIGRTAADLARTEGFISTPFTDTTIGGHPAKTFAISATGPACRPDTVHQVWNGSAGIRGHENDRIALVDVDGGPLLIHFNLGGSGPRPDIDAIIESISFNE